MKPHLHVRIWAFLLLLLFLLPLGGCGFKDLDKRFFVISMGVDLSDDPEKPYRVSLKVGIPSPKIEPGQTNKYQLVTEDAATIAEAVRVMKSKVDKELDFGHARIIVFGKTLVERGLGTSFDWFVRRRDIQMIADVAMGNPTAREVLDTSPKSERLPGNSLNLAFDHEGTESSFILTETLSDFNRRLREKGEDPYLPVIRSVGKRDFLIDQVVVLDKKKLKLVLTPDETRILNELMRNYHKFSMRSNEGGYDYILNVQTYKRKYKFTGTGKDVRLKINIAIAGMTEESTAPMYNQDWKKMQEAAQKQGGDRVKDLVRKLQKTGVDPLGFGLQYRAAGHVSDTDWETWQALYPVLPIDVALKVRILSSGVVK